MVPAVSCACSYSAKRRLMCRSLITLTVCRRCPLLHLVDAPPFILTVWMVPPTSSPLHHLCLSHDHIRGGEGSRPQGLVWSKVSLRTESVLCTTCPMICSSCDLCPLAPSLQYSSGPISRITIHLPTSRHSLHREWGMNAWLHFHV